MTPTVTMLAMLFSHPIHPVARSPILGLFLGLRLAIHGMVMAFAK
jgi:hypothetical protein